jgi:hypothetical protein
MMLWSGKATDNSLNVSRSGLQADGAVKKNFKLHHSRKVAIEITVY